MPVAFFSRAFPLRFVGCGRAARGKFLGWSGPLRSAQRLSLLLRSEARAQLRVTSLSLSGWGLLRLPWAKARRSQWAGVAQNPPGGGGERSE